MPAAPALVNHPHAGSVERVRLAIRPGVPGAAGDGKAIAAADPGLAVADWRDAARVAADGLVVSVAADPTGDRAWLRANVRNDAALPRPLRSVVLGFAWTHPPTGTLRYLRNGWQSWSETGARELDSAGTPAFPSGPWLRGLHHAWSEPPGDRVGWHESHGVTVVGADDAGPVCLVGVQERGESYGIVYARRRGERVEIEVELAVDAVLAPGETRELEAVEAALGVDASELLEDFALRHGRAVAARSWRPHVTGWCSWYYAFHDVGEDDVRRNLDALVALRDEIPIEVVQIDDGYQRATGDWLEPNARFPRGVAALAQEIRAAGFVAGLWTAPFCAVGGSELVEKHPDWLLSDGDSPAVAMIHDQWAADGKVFALDPSRDAVIAHLEALFRTLVDWGFFYHKLDFLFAASRGTPDDPGVGPARRVRRGLEAVRRGAGDEAFLLGCGSPLGPAVGIVDGMRIGPDVAPRWYPDPAFASTGIEATLPSTRSALRSILSRTWMHRRLWQNDPDCLMVRSRDTDLERCEREALAAAVAATGGMAVVSDDLPTLGDPDRRLLRHAIEGAARVDGIGIPGGARVADLLGASLPGRVLARDSEGVGWGLFNLGEHERSFTLPAVGDRELSILGPAPETSARAVRLPAHGAALGRSEHPVALAVFCDFDGTFSVQDVGATLAVRYAADERAAHWARYERGEITPWQYNQEILDGLPVGIPELEAFLQSVDLDPGAPDLLAWCRERDVPFRILSDGFDWNLNRLQAIHGVGFAYRANHLRVEGGRWKIRAGAPDPTCGCGTGVCKAGILRAFRARRPAARLVHIGNGRVSDTCGAIEADLAFAKDSLALELARRGEPFVAFETLHDVIPSLADALADASASGTAGRRAPGPGTG